MIISRLDNSAYYHGNTNTSKEASNGSPLETDTNIDKLQGNLLLKYLINNILIISSHDH